jgi:hypothetical protein
VKNLHSRPPKSAAAQFIAGRIIHLQVRRSQQEIASAAGFKSVNMLSMIKDGKAKLPLERVIALAKALECDPRHLMRLALEQNLTQPVLDEIFATSGGLSTVNEQGILQEIRRLAGNSDPVLTPELKKALANIFGLPPTGQATPPAGNNLVASTARAIEIEVRAAQYELNISRQFATHVISRLDRVNTRLQAVRHELDLLIPGRSTR